MFRGMVAARDWRCAEYSARRVPRPSHVVKILPLPARLMPAHLTRFSDPTISAALSDRECYPDRVDVARRFFMAFRPLHDRVLIRRVEGEEKTKGGIIIPDTAKEKPMEGEVVAAGPGARGEDGKLVPMDVKKGDRVLFGKWSGTEVKIDNEELIIMKESDIMGVIA